MKRGRGSQRTLAPLAEDLVLAHRQLLKDDLDALELDLSVIGQVPAHALEAVLPDPD